MRRAARGLGVLCWLAAAGPAPGAVTDVAPGEDIQQALDAAAPGDTVRLLAGRHLVLDGLVLRDGVALEGAARDATVIDLGRSDAPPADAQIGFPRGLADPRTRVAHLTVTGGHAFAGGAFHVDSQVGEIRGTRITGNRAASAGSAIFAAPRAGPGFLIAFNLIHHNFDSAGTDSHALELGIGARPTIQNNTIAYNDDNGIFVVSNPPGPRIVNNILFRNGRDFDPPVLLDPETGEPVSGVTGNVGRGICYFARPDGAEVLISHNLFVGNQRAALLVDGPFAGDYEHPSELQAVAEFLTGNRSAPRGLDDAELFGDAAAGDFRLQPESLAWDAGDPELAAAGVRHVGAEQQPALDPGCRVVGAGGLPEGSGASRLALRGGGRTLTLWLDDRARFRSAELTVWGCAAAPGGGRRAYVTGAGALLGAGPVRLTGWLADGGPGPRGDAAALRLLDAGGQERARVEGPLTRGSLRILSPPRGATTRR